MSCTAGAEQSLGSRVKDTMSSQMKNDEDLLTIIIPAHDEARYISSCLESLLAQAECSGAVEVVVVPNGCTDATCDIVCGYESLFQAKGWILKVVELKIGSKVNALNAGDAVAGGSIRLYLDADIICMPHLIELLRIALSRSGPLYATGRLQVAPAQSWITRRYGDFWCELPFVRGGAVGAGLYAVNAAGRALWGEFPRIIADDAFARLQFTPTERIEVDAGYLWPLVEGFSALVRVRRRQDAGMVELFRLYPELEKNDAKPQLTASWLLGALWRKPISGLVYIMVSLAVRSRRATAEWTRGR